MSGNKIESREQLIKALADEFDACAGEYTIPDKPRSRLQKYRLTETPQAVSPVRKPLPRCWSAASIRPVVTTSASAGTTSPGMW